MDELGATERRGARYVGRGSAHRAGDAAQRWLLGPGQPIFRRIARPALALVSEEEFLRLPESVSKVELIDGEVVVSPSPSFFHQEIVGRLVVLLRHWASRRTTLITVGQAPLDVRFGHGRILQPDVFVLFDRIWFDHEGPLDRVPELCIEVLSSRPSYDRLTKRTIYVVLNPTLA